METNQIRRANLKALVETVGLSEFAERVGRSKTQISSLTTGWRNMGERLARDFEKSLGLEAGYFDRETSKSNGDLKTILDQVGLPLVSWEYLLGSDRGETLGIVMASSNIPTNSLVLTIRDRSMEPTFSTGDQIIVDPSRKPKPSTFVVAVADGEPVLRKFKAVSKDEFELVPLNPDYPTLSNATSTIEIKGVAIQLRKNLES